MKTRFFLLFRLLLLTGFYSSVIAQPVVYVATTGNDANSGTLAQPFKTIQKGIAMVDAGGVINVRAGVYQEKVRFNKSGLDSLNRTLITSYLGESVTIEGGFGMAGAPIEIRTDSFIAITNLTVSQNGSQSKSLIHIHKGAHHIGLSNLSLKDVSTSGINLNAFGVLVEGDSAQPCQQILVDSCETFTSAVGPNGAAVGIIGNVNYASVSHNLFEQQAGSGVVISGNSITTPRNIGVSNNHVHDAGTSPSYLIHGGSYITFNANHTSFADSGLVIRQYPTLNPNGSLQYLSVSNNIFDALTGPAITVNPIGPQSVEYILIANNSVNYNNLVTSPAVVLGKIEYGLILNNIVNVQSGQPVMNFDATSFTTDIDYNMYYAGGGSPKYTVNGTQVLNNLSQIQQATNREGSSQLANPLFSNPIAGQFQLAATSPAIDAGTDDVLTYTVVTDYENQPRKAGNAVDIGAMEYKWAAGVPNSLSVNTMRAFSDGSGIQIIGTDASASISLINAMGQVVRTTKANAFGAAAFIEDIPVGLYWVSSTGKGRTQSTSVMVIGR